MWLWEYNPDGVFKGSITVAHQDPQAAAREIARWAGHPHFVQVMMDSGARAPYGQRQYYPIYEACQKYGYPLAIHPGTDGMGTACRADRAAVDAEFRGQHAGAPVLARGDRPVGGVMKAKPLRTLTAGGGGRRMPPIGAPEVEGPGPLPRRDCASGSCRALNA